MGEVTVAEACLYGFMSIMILVIIYVLIVSPRSKPRKISAEYPRECGLSKAELLEGKCQFAEKIGMRVDCVNRNCCRH